MYLLQCNYDRVLTVMAINCRYESEKSLLRYSRVISTGELVAQVLNHPESQYITVSSLGAGY